MYRYIISRVLLTFPTLIGAAALVFLLMRLVPGDICLVRLGSGGTSFTNQALAQCHADIGIDRPWILQFFDFIWGLARHDFGSETEQLDRPRGPHLLDCGFGDSGLLARHRLDPDRARRHPGDYRASV